MTNERRLEILRNFKSTDEWQIVHVDPCYVAQRIIPFDKVYFVIESETGEPIYYKDEVKRGEPMFIDGKLNNKYKEAIDNILNYLERDGALEEAKGDQ